MSDYRLLLEPLTHICFEAGGIAQKERANLTRELKPDGSIVSTADRKVEEYLRDILVELIPGSSVWGEEFGYAEEAEGGLWAVDPIDGTSNYVYGSPLWGVSIAFVKNNVIELGAIMLPDLNEIFLSAKGYGVYLNGEPLPPIPAGPVRKEELIAFNDSLARALPGKTNIGRRRDIGAFVISAGFFLTQRFRGVLAIREKFYDVAPSILMTEELGGEVRYANGAPMRMEDWMKDEPMRMPWIMFPKDSGYVVSDEIEPGSELD